MAVGWSPFGSKSETIFERDAGFGLRRALGPVRHEDLGPRQVFQVRAQMLQPLARAGGGALGNALHLLFGLSRAGLLQFLAGGRVGPGTQAPPTAAGRLWDRTLDLVEQPYSQLRCRRSRRSS